MTRTGGCPGRWEGTGHRCFQFLRDDLENLLSDCRVKPTVNQILLYISNIDMALINYSRDPGILVEAYSPITHGEAFKNPAMVEMEKKYGVSAAPLCIRYVVQLGNRCVA